MKFSSQIISATLHSWGSIIEDPNISAFLLKPRPRNNPQVAGEIRAEKIYTTHVNTMEPILF
jgi:hypothetical protein